VGVDVEVEIDIVLVVVVVAEGGPGTVKESGDVVVVLTSSATAGTMARPNATVTVPTRITSAPVPFAT
jgi:hypothetical protein